MTLQLECGHHVDEQRAAGYALQKHDLGMAGRQHYLCMAGRQAGNTTKASHLERRHHVDEHHEVGQQRDPDGRRVKAQHDAGRHRITQRSVAAHADSKVLQ